MHLAPIVRVLERTATEPVRALSSTPPQHGKTFLISHAYIWLMLRDRTRRHAYVTYQQARAHEVSREVYKLAQAAGLRPEGNVGLWHLPEGGSFRARGIDAGLTGAAVDGLLCIDDPHKNRAEAESATLRNRVLGEFDAAANTRTHATTSLVVNHTRWHPEDLIGTLSKRREWEPRINIPAIKEDGQPLWPERHPLWKLEQARDANEYDWWSLYMGEPRPRGGAVFRDVSFYEHAPTTGYRIAIGVDLAYTEKTHADFSVALVLAEWTEKREQPDGQLKPTKIYGVLDVRRQQVEAPAFAGTLRQLQAQYPGARTFSFIGGTEKGVIDFLGTQGIRISTTHARTDKFVRAQPVAAAWNAGRVLISRTAPWASAFTAELANFTGIGDKHDDQVDALAGAYSVLARGAGTSGVGGFVPRPNLEDRSFGV